MADEPEPQDPLDRSVAIAPLLSPAALATTLTRQDADPWHAYAHHRLISRELVSLHSRQPGAPRRLMIFAPPRHGKSELISHYFPVWNYALNPRTRIIMCSAAQHLATKFSRAVRKTIREHYPMVGTRMLEDSRAAHRWETRDGGEMFAGGIGTMISGRGAEVLLLDDPVPDAEAANSEQIRENTWDWWNTTFISRRAPDAIVVLIMTRWHEDDLAGRLLREEPELWQVVRLPALAEEDDPLGRQEGEALWPYDLSGKERYPVDYFLPIKRKTPRVFQALYQQSPSGLQGLAIQRIWWRRYEESPIEVAKACDMIVQTWDTTFKDTDSSDYVAGLVLGRIGHRIFLLDGVQKHLNAPDTMREIRRMRARWPQAKRILIEESANGPAIIQMLSNELPGITPVRAKGSKTVRLHWGVSSVAGFIQDGNFYLPTLHEKHLDSEQCVVEVAEELVNEGASFPHGAHDDILDSAVQGTAHLLPQGWASLGKWGREIVEETARNIGFVEAHKQGVLDVVKKRVDEAVRRRQHGSDLPGWN